MIIAFFFFCSKMIRYTFIKQLNPIMKKPYFFWCQGISVLCLFLFWGRSVSAESDLWIVDTTSVNGYGSLSEQFSKITFQCHDGTQWIVSDVESFERTHCHDRPIVFVVPGYSNTQSDTIRIGMKTRNLCISNESIPCRTVLWNWPSHQTNSRKLRDVRAKIPIAEANGKYLGLLLQRLEPAAKISILGCSFGSRIACAAILYLDENDNSKRRINLVLTAPALDHDWFSPSAKYGRIPEYVDKLLLFYNPNDRVLRLYPLIYGLGSNREAMGKVGPVFHAFQPEHRPKIKPINMSAELGDRHHIDHYLDTHTLKEYVASHLLFHSDNNVGSYLKFFMIADNVHEME